MSKKRKIVFAVAVTMAISMVFGTTAFAATGNSDIRKVSTITCLDSKELKQAVNQKDVGISATVGDDGTVVMRDQDGNIVTGTDEGQDLGVLQYEGKIEANSSGAVTGSFGSEFSMSSVTGTGIIATINEDGTIVIEDQDGNVLTGEEADQVLGELQGEGTITVSAENGNEVVSGIIGN